MNTIEVLSEIIMLMWYALNSIYKVSSGFNIEKQLMSLYTEGRYCVTFSINADQWRYILHLTYGTNKNRRTAV
jgi:hypothetical protein